VISATNADLGARIASGDFRQDLYFRLARFIVQTPPLRERPEDIPLLCAHFLQLFAEEMGMAAPVLSPEALDWLSTYAFPGNVRELKNLIERALIASGGKVIERKHVQFSASPSAPAAAPARDSRSLTAPAAVSTLPLNLDEAENALIQRALEQTRGNVAEAARLLGVNRSRIYRRFPQGTSS